MLNQEFIGNHCQIDPLFLSDEEFTPSYGNFDGGNEVLKPSKYWGSLFWDTSILGDELKLIPLPAKLWTAKEISDRIDGLPYHTI